MSRRLGAARPLLRSAWLPAVFAAAGLAVSAAWGSEVYRSFWDAGAIGPKSVLLLGRRVLAEFLACAAMVLLLWGGGRVRKAGVAAVVGLFALIQYAQFRCVVLSNDLLTATVLRMAEMAEYVVSPWVLAVAALGTAGSSLAAVLAARLAGLDGLAAGRRRAVGASTLLVAAAVGLVPSTSREIQLARDHGLRPRAPVVEFARTLWDLSRPAPPPAVRLGQADLELAAEYGITIRPDSPTPVVREVLHEAPLPFPRIRDTAHPNLIVLFAESLSAALTSPYNGKMTDVTPWMGRMAESSTRVDGYFNHAMPTIRGLRGQLCSVFTGYGHEAWRDAPEKLLNARMLCMPHLLAKSGYVSVALSPAPRREVRVESQFLDFGFDELYFREELLREILPGESGVRQGVPSDRQMFRSLISLLEHRDRSRPLFVALSTVETHTGWELGPDGVPYGDGRNRVLNGFHNLDAAFGEFWRWFETSTWRDDTIVVLTGDHVLWPHDEARRALETGEALHDVDEMVLLIHDPIHALPGTFRADTSSIDFAPTLLQLAGVSSQSVPFAGWSFFSDRGRYRGGPGQGEFRELLRWEDGKPVVEDATLEGCADAPARDTHACSLLRVLTYLQGLESENRLWRGAR